MKALALLVIGGLACGSGYLAYNGGSFMMWLCCGVFAAMFVACCFDKFKN